MSSGSQQDINDIKLKNIIIGAEETKSTEPQEIYYVDKEYQKQFSQLAISDYKQDIYARGWLYEWASVLVSLWLFFVLLIIVAKGQNKLNLSDSVIITLLTTSTANVIGIMIISMNYFYEKKRGKKNN